MISHRKGRERRPGRGWAGAVSCGLAALMLIVAPAVAFAHGDGEPTGAVDLIRQSIALIVNTPDDTDKITDKINDAAETPDTTGVNLPLVEQAQDALAAGDLHRTRTLLEQAIGARMHTGDADPVVIGNVPPPAAGEDTGTLAAIDALPGRSGLHGRDWTVLGISIVLALAGALLSVRLRPHPSTPPTGR